MRFLSAPNFSGPRYFHDLSELQLLVELPSWIPDGYASTPPAPWALSSAVGQLHREGMYNSKQKKQGKLHETYMTWIVSKIMVQILYGNVWDIIYGMFGSKSCLAPGPQPMRCNPSSSTRNRRGNVQSNSKGWSSCQMNACWLLLLPMTTCNQCIGSKLVTCCLRPTCS